MRPKKLIKTITLSVIASAMFVGCGGGSDSAPIGAETESGTTTVNGIEIESGTSTDAPVSVDNILNKQFEHIQCSNLLGCSSDATFSLTDTTFTGTEKNGNEFTFSYTKEPEGDILYLESEGGGNYTKILSISDATVKVCSDNATHEKAQVCSQANEYWVVPANAAQFIATENAVMGSVLTEKTQITNFANIQNKFLYQITNGSDGIKKNAIKIDLDGKLSFYYASSLSADIRLVPDNADNYYNTSFENNLLHIEGMDEGEVEDNTYTVSKYNLAGQSISVKDFADGEIFDEDGLADKYTEEKVFSFTSGNMYCTLLWSECWVDEAAINQMIAQSQPEVTSPPALGVVYLPRQESGVTVPPAVGEFSYTSMLFEDTVTGVLSSKTGTITYLTDGAYSLSIEGGETCNGHWSTNRYTAGPETGTCSKYFTKAVAPNSGEEYSENDYLIVNGLVSPDDGIKIIGFHTTEISAAKYAKIFPWENVYLNDTLNAFDELNGKVMVYISPKHYTDTYSINTYSIFGVSQNDEIIKVSSGTTDTYNNGASTATIQNRINTLGNVFSRIGVEKPRIYLSEKVFDDQGNVLYYKVKSTPTRDYNADTRVYTDLTSALAYYRTIELDDTGYDSASSDIKKEFNALSSALGL